MAFKILDRARMSVSGAPSTGNVTLSTAVTGYQSFAQAGLQDGDTFAYSITDGTKWEFGVGTYSGTGTPSFSRAVTKTSNQNAVALDLSSTCTVTAVLRGEDVAQATTLAGLTDVAVTPASVIDGFFIYWDNTAGKFQAKALAWADISDAPTIPTNSSFLLQGLGDCSLATGPTEDGWSLTWNNGSNRFVMANVSGGGGGGGATALSGLSDVSLSSPSSGQFLRYNGTAWANYTLTLPTNGSFSLVGLGDVNVTTGSGVNGYSLVWNNSSGKFELSNVSGGGGGGGGGSPPTIVQSGVFAQADAPFTMGSTPTAGNLLVAIISHWASGAALGAGWTQVLNRTGSNDFATIVWKIAQAGDTTSLSPFTSNGGVGCSIFEIAGATNVGTYAALVDVTSATQTIAIGATAASLVVGQFSTTGSSTLPSSISGATAGSTATHSSGASGDPRGTAAFHETPISTGVATVTATYSGSVDANCIVVVVT